MPISKNRKKFKWLIFKHSYVKFQQICGILYHHIESCFSEFEIGRTDYSCGFILEKRERGYRHNSL